MSDKTDRDLLIELSTQMKAVLAAVEKINVMSSRIQKLEDKPVIHQPCVWFKELKDNIDKEKNKSSNFKMWLIGLSVTNAVVILIGIVTALATYFAG